MVLVILNISFLCSFRCLVDDQVLTPKVKVKVDSTLQRLVKSRNGTDVGRRVYDFFLALAACNTIVPIVSNSSDSSVRTIDYQGESPDEQALVFAAAAYGFMLVERTSGHIVIDIQGERQRSDLAFFSCLFIFVLLCQASLWFHYHGPFPCAHLIYVKLEMMFVTKV